jgi:hypothetical protein
MQILIQKGSKLQYQPTASNEITFVVFMDDEGHPIGLVEQLGANVIQFSTCQDDNFAQILRRLGVSATIPSVEVRRA